MVNSAFVHRAGNVQENVVEASLFIRLAPKHARSARSHTSQVVNAATQLQISSGFVLTVQAN